jgi:hypothetical protein
MSLELIAGIVWIFRRRCKNRVADLRSLVAALFRKTACFGGQGGIVLMVEEVRQT